MAAGPSAARRAQSNATTPYVAAGSTNSTCVAVDLIFTDGSTLRDSEAVDQNGNKAHPASQCGHLTLDAWNHVTVNLATNNANKQVSRILIGYDHPNSTGGYRGYVDDLRAVAGAAGPHAVRHAGHRRTFSHWPAPLCPLPTSTLAMADQGTLWCDTRGSFKSRVGRRCGRP